MINIQSTLRTAPDLCKNVSPAVLFGNNGTPYTVYTQSHMCTYLHIFFTLQGHRSGKRNKIKLGTAVNTACQGNLSACHFGYAFQRFAIHQTERAIQASLTIKVSFRTAGFIIIGAEPSRSAARRLNTELLKDVQLRINSIMFTDTVGNFHH